MSHSRGFFDDAASYFVPSSLASEGGLERRRAEIMVKTVFAAVIWGPIMSILYYAYIGSITGALLCASATVTTLLAPVLLRWSESPLLAGNFLVAALLPVFVGITYITGGTTGYGLSWLLLLPVFALIFAGLKSAIVWIAISLITCAAIFGMDVSGWASPQQVADHKRDVFRLFEVVGLGGILYSTIILKDGLQNWLVENLKQKQAETAAILGTAPDGIVTIDAEGFVQSANEASGGVFGLDVSEVVGRAIDELVPTLSVEGAAGRGSIGRSGDHIGVRADGTRFPVEASGAKLGPEGGAQAVVILRDITERKRREEELLEARDEALEANRAKSAFLANMSHELRTPLNAVIGYSEMLMEDIEAIASDAASRLKPDLERIRSAGKHLLDIVTNILDLSKIEAGRTEMDVGEFAVSDVIDEAVSTVRPLSDSNSNDLVVDIDDDPGTMTSDEAKLRQVLVNLLSNACKFTNEGRIELHAARNSGGEVDDVEFTVSDDGIGMGDQQLERVFDAFTQADESTTRKFGGTGLGLTITQHFVSMLQGEMEMSSTAGEGTTVVIRVPARLAATRTDPGKPDAQMERH